MALKKDSSCVVAYSAEAISQKAMLERTAELFNMIVKCNRDPPFQVFANNT